MRKLLIKLFIKDYKNTKDEDVRRSYGSLSGIVGLFSNILLAVVKIITGFLSGSVSIMADGINNLSDSFSSIVTIIGFKLSSIPADKEHPYGHQRLEYIAGLIISFIILMVGLIFLKSSIEKIINPEPLEVDYNTIIILSASILLKVWQSIFYHKNGKEIDSGTLKALAHDSLNDVLATLAVLAASIVFIFYPEVNLDGYMGFVVSIIVLISGVKLLKETSSPLIGEVVADDFIEDLNNEISSYPNVIGVHDLVCHKYGSSKIFMTAHVEVDYKIGIIESHELADLIEKDFHQKHKINLVIHIDPLDPDDEETNNFKIFLTEVLEKIDPVLGFHDFRIVKAKNKTKVIFDLVIPSKFYLTEDELKKKIRNYIIEKNKHLDVIMIIDHIYK